MGEAWKRYQQWQAAGSPPCDHTNRDREYDLGMHTGDTACLTCGESFSPAEEAELRKRDAERKQAAGSNPGET